MILKLLDLFAPDHCIFCGKTGICLCDKCKNNINTEKYYHCLICDQNIEFNQNCACGNQKLPLLADQKTSQLKTIIQAYKFDLNRVLADDISALIYDNLQQILTDLNSDKIILIPLPTAYNHVRQRGFDHSKLLAKKLAKKANLRWQMVLDRSHNLRQVGQKSAQRHVQAQSAYRLNAKIDPDTIYLLLDDVVTTGASMRAAASLLKQAGAEKIIGMALIRN